MGPRFLAFRICGPAAAVDTLSLGNDERALNCGSEILRGSKKVITCSIHGMESLCRLVIIQEDRAKLNDGKAFRKTRTH